MKVAIVGATGLVGKRILDVLAQRKFPVKGLNLYASERSKGEKLLFQNQEVEVYSTFER